MNCGFARRRGEACEAALPQASNDVHSFEIGDLCGGFVGSLIDGTNTYEVTQYYLNRTRGCSTGNYQSP